MEGQSVNHKPFNLSNKTLRSPSEILDQVHVFSSKPKLKIPGISLPGDQILMSVVRTLKYSYMYIKPIDTTSDTHCFSNTLSLPSPLTVVC